MRCEVLLEFSGMRHLLGVLWRLNLQASLSITMLVHPAGLEPATF